MSERVANVEIDDVLTSIRRLVADGDWQRAEEEMAKHEAAQAEAQSEAEEDETASRFVLTPSLRVASRSDTANQDDTAHSEQLNSEVVVDDREPEQSGVSDSQADIEADEAQVEIAEDQSEAPEGSFVLMPSFVPRAIPSDTSEVQETEQASETPANQVTTPEFEPESSTPDFPVPEQFRTSLSSTSDAEEESAKVEVNDSDMVPLTLQEVSEDSELASDDDVDLDDDVAPWSDDVFRKIVDIERPADEVKSGLTVDMEADETQFALKSTIAGLEAAVGGQDAEFEPDGTEEQDEWSEPSRQEPIRRRIHLTTDPEDAETLVDTPPEPPAPDAPMFAHSGPDYVADETLEELASDLSDFAESEAITSASEPEAYATEMDEELDGFLDDGGMVDEDMLRKIVSDVVRDQLQGELGERITRNVRKLVRREIYRALASQEFE